jgi:hypothetical protein
MEGISTQTDTNGEVTHITIDLIKHREAIPALEALGFIEKRTFEERFDNALTIEEARELTNQHIRHLFAKDGRSEDRTACYSCAE